MLFVDAAQRRKSSLERDYNQKRKYLRARLLGTMKLYKVYALSEKELLEVIVPVMKLFLFHTT